MGLAEPRLQFLCIALCNSSPRQTTGIIKEHRERTETSSGELGGRDAPYLNQRGCLPSPPSMDTTRAIEEAVAAFTRKVEKIAERCHELERKVRKQEETLSEAQRVEEELNLLKRLPAKEGERRKERVCKKIHVRARSRLNRTPARRREPRARRTKARGE